jgi:GAF domain-containing protein
MILTTTSFIYCSLLLTGPAAKYGARSLIAVPMRKESELVGAFVIYRTEVRPFNDRQIALVTSFANQAVIAIENARLLNELRGSLEQQTERLELCFEKNGREGPETNPFVAPNRRP